MAPKSLVGMAVRIYPVAQKACSPHLSNCLQPKCKQARVRPLQFKMFDPWRSYVKNNVKTSFRQERKQAVTSSQVKSMGPSRNSWAEAALSSFHTPFPRISLTVLLVLPAVLWPWQHNTQSTDPLHNLNDLLVIS